MPRSASSPGPTPPSIEQRLQTAHQATSSGPRRRRRAPRCGDQPRLSRASPGATSRDEESLEPLDHDDDVAGAARSPAGSVRRCGRGGRAPLLLVAVPMPVGSASSPISAARNARRRACACRAVGRCARPTHGRGRSTARCRPAAVMRVSVASTGTKWRWPRRAAIATTSCTLQPTLAQLDRCAAFDDAVVQLQDRDPLRDRGAVRRACGDRSADGAAAGLLSDDYLAIDGAPRPHPPARWSWRLRRRRPQVAPP